MQSVDQESMKDDRDVEKRCSLSEFVTELRRLADALEAGEPFEIEIEGELVQVPLSALASIEHEREDGSEEIEFQLSWGSTEDEEEDEDESDSEAEAETNPGPEAS